MLKRQSGKYRGIMKAGMDLQRCLVQPSAHSEGSYEVRGGCAGLENPQGLSLHSPYGQPIPLLDHPPGNYKLAENVGLLNWYYVTEAAIICFMAEYQIYECRNRAGEVFSCFQNRDVVPYKQKSIFCMGGGKSTRNPWMKSADKFKLKKNSSNYFKSFNSFEENAWPNFRQNNPLEILRDRERQASRFRKIFKQGPLPVSDSVSHRFFVPFFFSSENVKSQSAEICKRDGRNQEISSLQPNEDFSLRRLHFSAKFNTLILSQESWSKMFYFKGYHDVVCFLFSGLFF